MSYILWGVALLILGFIAFTYNSFVSLTNKTKEAWSGIDVQLKRRYDLIPNLVSIVKGYAKHEAQTFENVTKARTAAMGAGSVDQKDQTEKVLEGALKSLFAVAEAYPELKANQNFLALQQELSETEDKIEMSRRFYNGNVRDLNTKVEHFPSNIVAKAFAFQKQPFFEADQSEKAVVSVDTK